MPQRITCKTLFDITATGVKSHYKSSIIPFTDASGKVVLDLISWTRSRNKQRNWETINQIISLRSLPYDISTPVCVDNVWEFDFSVDNIEEIALHQDSMGALKNDCTGVPMIVGLDETETITPFLSANTDSANIWFSVNTNK
jgi:hypothetical protein